MRLAAIFLAGVVATGAQAATLDFEGLGLSNRNLIPAGYGGIPGEVAIDNRTREGFGNSSVRNEHVLFWTTGYGSAPGLVNNVYASFNGGVGEFAFTPAAGKEVTFESFRAASYFNGPTRTATFRIYDAAWSVVWALENETVSSAPQGFTPGVTLAGPLYFQWGTDWNVGVDDIAFSVADIGSTTTPIPVPAALPLLATALAGLGFVARRRA
jgi:hypothetical protein